MQQTPRRNRMWTRRPAHAAYPAGLHVGRPAV